MGVKSTIHLTRAEAIRKLVEYELENARKHFEATFSLSSNEWIEDTLEDLNDERNGGEGFENYTIDD